MMLIVEVPFDPWAVNKALTVTCAPDSMFSLLVLLLFAVWPRYSALEWKCPLAVFLNVAVELYPMLEKAINGSLVS